MKAQTRVNAGCAQRRHSQRQGHHLLKNLTDRLTAYDAAYLELVIRKDLPLATLDRSETDRKRS
jgi:predicted nucleic acid-binding protein